MSVPYYRNCVHILFLVQCPCAIVVHCYYSQIYLLVICDVFMLYFILDQNYYFIYRITKTN